MCESGITAIFCGEKVFLRSPAQQPRRSIHALGAAPLLHRSGGTGESAEGAEASRESAVSPVSRLVIPFVGCGDLSGFDADQSYPLCIGEDDEYQHREPVQKPIAPPYEAYLRLHGNTSSGLRSSIDSGRASGGDGAGSRHPADSG